MRRARIGVLQAEWTTDTEANLHKMESLVTNLHREWGDRVNLLTFCEYAVTGFDPQRLREAAETVPGPATERLAQLARNTGYYLCNGSMLERDGDDLFNTAIIFSPDGEIVHRYRKTHPWCPPVGGEDICFGREFPVTEIPGVGKIGTMICYDAYFPEVARSLAFNGAEIILWNSMGFHPWKDIAVATAITRAVENSCYVILSAGSGVHVGIGLHGNSMIVDPHGVVIMRVGDSPTIAMDVIDADNVTVARTEGGKGVLLPWQHLAQFGHDYPYQQSGKLAAEKSKYKRPKSA
jgi:predicted amidohydrolase